MVEGAISKPHYTPILIALLIIAAYFLGTLTTKIQYLEGTKKTTTTTSQEAPSAPTQQITPPDIGHLPTEGDKNAKVTVIEFSDFQCPFCKRMFDETISLLRNDYVKTGKIKFAYRHYPLSFHQNAHKAAQASECASEQQKFWEYHDLLFKNQDVWANQSATQAAATFGLYATELGLDATQFDTCLQTEKYKEKVDEDFAAGNKAGVSGTPTTFINGKSIVGAQPYEAFKTEIETALKSTQ